MGSVLLCSRSCKAPCERYIWARDLTEVLRYSEKNNEALHAHRRLILVVGSDLRGALVVEA